MIEPLKIGLLGLGTVGGGVARLLAANREVIAERAGRAIEIGYVLVRDAAKFRTTDVDPALLTTDFGAILDDPAIAIVVEVMGGVDVARQCITAALARGKSVVTANKDLLALHGAELFAAASQGGAELYFEASVGGGIPIVHALKECLAGNRILKVTGIVNGTTNYILTRMSREGAPFAEVLSAAQGLGYAEPDPTADVEGDDAARKMAILASLAFNTRVTSPQVFREGIAKITPADLRHAASLGYAVKLIGIASEDESGVEVRVHPAFLPQGHPLAAVNDVYNAIFVEGDAVGQTMFYGRGAGAMPTASAVVGDIMTAASRHGCPPFNGRAGCTCFYDKLIKPMEAVFTRYYLRLNVVDQPGVLAAIAGAFGRHGVSIATVIQKDTFADRAELIFITHRVCEQNLQASLKELAELPVVHEIANVIRVEGGNC